MHLPELFLRTQPGDNAMQIHPAHIKEYFHEKSDPRNGVSRLDVDIRMQSNSTDQGCYAIIPGALL